MNSKPLLYLVDDEKEVTQALTWLLESMDYAVETFYDGSGFLQQFNDSNVGCILLDIRMPGMSGIEIHRELLKKNVNKPVIYISGHADVPLAIEAMKLGAHDFFVKPINNQRLLESVKKAVANNETEQTQTGQHIKLLSKVETLSSREKQILTMIVKGLSTKEIASHYDISSNTVDQHRAHIIKKLGIKKVSEIIYLIMEMFYTSKPSIKARLNRHLAI